MNDRKQYHHEYYLKNKDRLIKQHMDYNKKCYPNNKDDINQNRRKHYNANKDEINRKRREYYQLNKEKRRKAIYTYRKNNRDKYLETRRKHWHENNDQLNEYQREWHNNNIEYVRQRARNYRKTDNGKLAINRAHSKRKNLESIEKYVNILDEPYHWHHINNKEVVAIPEDVHKLYSGVNKECHRENLNYIVEQLYPSL